VRLLPLAEFTYNNIPLVTTGISSFFANKGYHPYLDIQAVQVPSSKATQRYAVNLEKLHTELKRLFAKVQLCYQKLVNNKRISTPQIKVGDCVFVLAKFIRTTHPSKKLSEKYLGPFEITGKLGTYSYLVNLPEHLQSIHPVFHISQLEPATTSQIPNHTNLLLPPIKIDRNLKFEVAQVLNSKLDKQKKNLLLYYVCWASYEGTVEEYSWLAATNLEKCCQIDNRFPLLLSQKARSSVTGHEHLAFFVN